MRCIDTLPSDSGKIFNRFNRIPSRNCCWCLRCVNNRVNREPCRRKGDGSRFCSHIKHFRLFAEMHDLQTAAVRISKLDLYIHGASFCRLNFFSVHDNPDIKETRVVRRSGLPAERILGFCQIICIISRRVQKFIHFELRILRNACVR